MDYERIILVKPAVSIYANIPSTGGGRGHRADHWDLANPTWSGRVRVCTYGPKCVLKLEDKTTGDLFAECPINDYPSVTSIEPVIDSSRYFVVKIVNGLDHAFVGMGFDDRSDSFDLRVTLQEHFRQLKKERDIKEEEDNPAPSKDYSLKDGQSIKIDFKGFKKAGAEDTVPKPTGVTKGGTVKMSGGMILPPPSAKKATEAAKTTPQLTPTLMPPIITDPFQSTPGELSDDPFKTNPTETSESNQASGGGWVTF